MQQYLTSKEVAERLRCDKSTVTRIANRINVGMQRGQMIFFTEAEVKQIKVHKHDTPGNPNFGKNARKKRAPKNISQNN